MSEMLIAHSSGFVEDDGELVEINAGRTRIAPEVLARGGYEQYFDPCVGVKGTDASRSVVRTTGPNGGMVADERF